MAGAIIVISMDTVMVGAGLDGVRSLLAKIVMVVDGKADEASPFAIFRPRVV